MHNPAFGTQIFGPDRVRIQASWLPWSANITDGIVRRVAGGLSRFLPSGWAHARPFLLFAVRMCRPSVANFEDGPADADIGTGRISSGTVT